MIKIIAYIVKITQDNFAIKSASPEKTNVSIVIGGKCTEWNFIVMNVSKKQIHAAEDVYTANMDLI